MVDMSQLEHALSEFRPLLATDGGDIRLDAVDQASGTVAVQIVIGENACSECIIEPQMLREIVVEFFTGKQIPGVSRIEVRDPRTSA